MSEPLPLPLPAEFEGQPEAEIWARVVATRPTLKRNQTELVAAAVRALADEEAARREMQAGIDAGDVTSARVYANMAKEARAQAAKLLSDLA